MAASGLLSLLVTIVIAGLIFWLVWWFINFVGLPEPFNKVTQVIVGLAALVFLLSLLIGGGSHPLVFRW